MNRAKRRKMMRKYPRTRDYIRETARNMVDEMEKRFEKDDETLNEGAIVDVDNGEDEKLNY